MCGIYGAIGRFYADIDQVFSENLSHRGPDGKGFYLDHDTSISLGHTRLSIIDLSEQANQPMSDPVERFVLVFNGEIYNFREIRQELESLGVNFRTNSDTETVLLGFAQWGEKVVTKLRGMFAFAIYDKLQRQLFLARDRFGIKPLIYSFQNDGFVFSSELKPLLASGMVDKVVDPRAVDDLYTFGSICQPKTIIKNVFQLPPGHIMRVDLELKHSVSSYYHIPAFTGAPALDISYHEAVETVRELLDKATKYHLVADVDVGAFLSGGVDSTAIVALMSQYVNKPIKAFSIGFSEQVGVHDESLVAGQTAERLGADFNRIVINDNQVDDIFDDFIQALDQPSIDGINTFLVSRFAAMDVKVALSGLGGDEVFAGYPHFSSICQATKMKIRPWDYPAKLIHNLRPNRFTATAAIKGLNVADALFSVRSIHSSRKRRRMLANVIDEKSGYSVPDSLSPIQKISYLEITNYLSNTLLRDADAVSMWHSLEVRPVLLDHELVEFVCSLPDHFKIRNGRLKALLIDSVKDIIPENVWRAPKRGFEMPFAHWMNGVLNDRFSHLLTTSSAKAVFRPEYRNTLTAEVSRKNTARSHWTSLVLLAWLEQNKAEVGRV